MAVSRAFRLPFLCSLAACCLSFEAFAQIQFVETSDAAGLPNGFRALTLEMDPHNGLSGFLYPEARVDIIAALGGLTALSQEINRAFPGTPTQGEGGPSDTSPGIGTGSGVGTPTGPSGPGGRC